MFVSLPRMDLMVRYAFDAEYLVLPEEPVLAEKPTAHQKRIREPRAALAVNHESILRQTMR